MQADGQETAPAERSRIEAPPIEFNFDARNKSIVPRVFALEASRLKKFFARKPKVSLHQIEEALKQSANEATIRRLSQGFVTFYMKQTEAHQFLESFARLLLEAASKEKEDTPRQWFLLSHAVDMCALALQKSPKVLNIAAQSVIVSILRIMGSSLRESYIIEREVHKEMLTMLNVKKDPNDFASREKLIKLYLRGRKYYEALIHAAEYEKVMQVKSRSLYRQKKGEIAMRKAGIFQSMVDFFYKLRTGELEEGVNKHNEISRLSQFITRFNRDNKRVNIVPLKGIDTLSLNKTLLSLVNIANSFYREASIAEHFPARHKAYFFIAKNNYQFDNVKAALQTLHEGVRMLDVSTMPEGARDKEKLNFLEFQHKIYSELGQQRKADELTQDISKIRRAARTGGGNGGNGATQAS